ncbi:MAG: cyclase family protein [Pseudomonadota bacterium]
MIFRCGAWLLVIALAGCVSAPQDSDPQLDPGLDLARYQMLDLSHPYNAETLYWPSSPSAFEHGELEYGTTEEGYFYSAYTLGTPEHGGTHIDAPIHFHADGLTVEQLALEQLILPVVVLDVRAEAAADPDYTLTMDAINAHEAKHGAIVPGSAVLMWTAWDQYWPDALGYLGDDTPDRTTHLHFPGFGVQATEFLLQERQVRLIGLDTASIDHGPSTDFLVHRLTGAAGVPGLENLTGLEQLPPTGATLIALPMKIEGGSGAPVRVVALVPR